MTRKKMLTMVFLAMLVTVLLSSLAVQADDRDFTFNIKVEVERIPAPWTIVRVTCRTGINNRIRPLIGGARVLRDLVDGAYNGNVVISFNASGDASGEKNPADAKNWACEIDFQQPNGSVGSARTDVGNDLHPAEGTEFVRRISGPLPFTPGEGLEVQP